MRSLNQSMKKATRPVLIIVGLLFTGYISAAWYFSSMVVAFPVRTLEADRVRLKIKSITDFGLLNPQDVSFKNAADGTTLSGWYVRGSQPCAVVFAHGFGSTRYGMLKYSPLLAGRHCHLLFYDARHHGDSYADFGSFGFFEKQDLLSAVDFLQQSTGVTDARTAIIGESYGAAAALQAVGLSQRRFWFLLVDSPYIDMRTIITEQAVQRYTKAVQILSGSAIALAGMRAGFDPDQSSSLLYARSIRTPVLIVHSLSDTYTAPRHSERIASELLQAGIKCRLLLTDWNANHARSINDNFAEYNAVFQDFLKDLP